MGLFIQTLFEHGWLFILGGVLAGMINTFAGNGSLITLTMLLELAGLPAHVANATNRVGIVFQSTAALVGMPKRHKNDAYGHGWILAWIFLGGIIGGLLSIYVSEQQFLIVYKTMLIVVMLSLIVNPKRWLRHDTDDVSKIPKWLRAIAFIVIGMYGGFIQMGMGIFLLMALVLMERIPIMPSNVLKLIAVMLYTVPLLVVFVITDHIYWTYGILLAIGQLTGGWVAGRYLSRWERASELAYAILLVMVILAIWKVFFT